MAKMRVHELAKELDIKSQEIIEVLGGTEYEVKSPNSNIEDAAQEIVRKKFQSSTPKKKEPEKARRSLIFSRYSTLKCSITP